MAKFILVGADPENAKSSHPGGVVTLSLGLLDFGRRMGHEFAVVDTFRSGFTHLSFLRRVGAGLQRIRRMIGLLRNGEISGAFIIAGAGFSFYERILLSLLCRSYGVKDAFIIVDGNFFAIRRTGFLKRAIYRLLLKIPHRLIATGRNWSELFLEFGVPPQSQAIMHYWLPSTFMRSDSPKAAPAGGRVRMLFVGWMIPEKGVPELLAAISQLIDKYDLHVQFVGGGPLLDHVRERIAAMGWEGRISASGWISATELQTAFAAADVFVLPSHAEGFPMSLIEAFSSGLPAIVTDVGGVSESLEDGVNGFLITPRSERELVEAMRSYLEDPSQIARHSVAALAAARRNHDPDTNCGVLFDVIERDA